MLQYTEKRIGERIIFIPNKEYEEALKFKLKRLRDYSPKSEINAFGVKGSVDTLLPRHRGYRFFITIDLVHAFHNTTREMVGKFFPVVTEPTFDVCFVEMGLHEVLPMGFCTSNYLFELFMSRRVDEPLITWQDRYQATVTRYTDNILVTWRKNPTKEAVADLLRIFRGLSIRVTPKKPQKCERDNPIRFCGGVISKSGRVRLSRSRKREILGNARKKSLVSLDGAVRFVTMYEEK